MIPLLRTKFTSIIVTLFCVTKLQAQTIPQYTTVPRFYDFLPNALSDWLPMIKNADPREHPSAYLSVLSLTGALIYYDQDILVGSQHYASRMGLITPEDAGAKSRVFYTKKIFSINADLRLPQGTNSSLYYIGDGLTSLAVIGGITSFGLFADDKRALNTASQMMESMALTGSFVLPGKYLSGRESPHRATEAGGAWRPAPGVKAYLSNVSKHDAFPSGHIATVMSGLTILHRNYPEKAWILPVGYASMGLLMFAMLNNGQHWAGDYPVGIAIGYLAATTVFEKRKPQDFNPAHTSATAATKKSYDLLPFANSQGFGLLFDLRT